MSYFIERIWQFILVAVTIVVVTVLTILSVKDHPVRGYYLGSYCERMVIYIDIDWAPDEKIVLDRSITIQEAVILVNNLNDTVKKK